MQSTVAPQAEQTSSGGSVFPGVIRSNLLTSLYMPPYREPRLTTATAYVDSSVLNLLAGPASGTAREIHAMRMVWQAFSEHKVRLVTCSQETGTDIILWLNKQGCCITDTLRAVEGIEEFERWEKADRDETRAYKRMIFCFEQLDGLPSGPRNPYAQFREDQGSRKNLELLFLREFPCIPDVKASPEADQGMDGQILRECLAVLDRWYTDVLWRDLRRTDYEINWAILESVLKLHNMEPAFAGNRSAWNRNLFGLLNRAVGLSKKSSGKLPMTDNHIDFILKTVIRKYQYREEERHACHILRCMAHDIPFFVTADAGLIELFKEKRNAPLHRPHIPDGYPDVLRPSDFLARSRIRIMPPEAGA